MKLANIPQPYETYAVGIHTMLANKVQDDTNNKAGRPKVYIVTGYDTK